MYYKVHTHGNTRLEFKLKERVQGKYNPEEEYIFYKNYVYFLLIFHEGSQRGHKTYFDPLWPPHNKISY